MAEPLASKRGIDIVLCGLESKPKLNGRAVRLLHYHADRGRWEVELQGQFPSVEVFRLHWRNEWFEPLGAQGHDEVPLFREDLEASLEKFAANLNRHDLLVTDCNDENVQVFDAAAAVREELSGKYLARRPASKGDVWYGSFPLQFKRAANKSEGTLAIRACCLRIKETADAAATSKQKVEISVSPAHRKPQLDGQVGTLLAFHAPSWSWQVQPDVKVLSDVKVNGDPCPVLLKTTEIHDEDSGAAICTPIGVEDRTPLGAASCAAAAGLALFAKVAFRAGQVIAEDEPVIMAQQSVLPLNKDSKQVASKSMMARDPAWIRLCQIFAGLDSDKRAILLKLTPGPDHLCRLWTATGEPSKQIGLEERDILPILQEADHLDCSAEDAWKILRIMNNNFLLHSCLPDWRMVFPLVARINHSCKPNALLVDVSWEELTGDKPKKCIIALRSIAKGEDITISYLPDEQLLQPRAERQAALDRWGFTCSCSRCLDSAGDASVRALSCRSSQCTGHYSATGDTISACCICGSVLDSPRDILEAETMFANLYKDAVLSLAEGQVAGSVGRFVEVLEGATFCGLSQHHWLVVGAQRQMSLHYRTNGNIDLAVEHTLPMLALHEKVLERPSHILEEEIADLYVQAGSYIDAMRHYAAAVRAIKTMVPENTPCDSTSLDRLRQKLRATIDAKRIDS
eukprot:TRINITY_DN38126_c0_g2_i1.p1 TRINITY_DN38126_c0_g2~~TRINITY_DN38126_c0_g2_i1.p1  ORF type:complete len:685 (+),score=114.40 TRINITY_DN38126_c0_g2_i1:173-2227(+)